MTEQLTPLFSESRGPLDLEGLLNLILADSRLSLSTALEPHKNWAPICSVGGRV